MIIDTITDSRDSHFAIYKQVEASGLAFAELGKVGYKLELTKDVVLDEIKAAQDIYKWDDNYNDPPPPLDKNKTIVTNINYWLDKVFPNEKVDGKITKWLTPWCYEIRMDWQHYTEERDSDKIYDDAFISNWTVDGSGDKATLIPTEKTAQQEKARIVDCTNSNKYNITQDIAEAFEVFCRYEYKCDQSGKFIKTYVDETTGGVWTGRKVIFYNHAIKTEDPIVVDYQKNLQSIERTSDSSEIYTKLYVTKLEAEEMSNGYVTIADTTANPLRDEFILNFDHLINTGALNAYQQQFIGTYKAGIADANRRLIPLLEAEEEGIAELKDLKATASFHKNAKEAAEKLQKEYWEKYDNIQQQGPVIKDSNNSYSVIFIEESKDSNLAYASLGLYGINADSIQLYGTQEYEGLDPENLIPPLFDAEHTKIVYSAPNIPNGDSDEEKVLQATLFIELNEHGYPKRLYRYNNDKDEGLGTVWVKLTYTPKNEYEKIYQYYSNKVAVETDKETDFGKYVENKTGELFSLEQSVQTLLQLKKDLNNKLEHILGPALREGYWTPDDYEDHSSQVIKSLEKDKDILEFNWDSEAYSFETSGWYSRNSDKGLEYKCYPYIKIPEAGIDFSKNACDKLILYRVGELKSAPITTEIVKGWKWFQIGSTRYYVNIPSSIAGAEEGKEKYFIFTRKAETEKSTFQLYDAGSTSNYTIQTSKPNTSKTIPELRPAFDDINNNWNAYYYNVHFKYAFIKQGEPEVYIPCIVLLEQHGGSLGASSLFAYTFEGDNPTYDIYKGYNFDDRNYATLDDIPTMYHPRITIKEKNIQTTSSLFTIVNTRNEQILERYEDYVVIISDGYPIITLKPNAKNTLEDLCGNKYKIGYTASKANEYMYLDAVKVAKDNSIPRYTYSLQIANLPHDFSHIELGQMLYINDHSLGVHTATGYVNKIDYALDQPQEDGVEVQNYKTKFEDLFSTITAQSEAMKTNRRAYEIAAQAFTSTTNGGVMGQISGSVLQSALKNNSYLLNWSATGVEITPDQGIILTNKTPYSNGVTGQVILQGGGIFLSDSIDVNGNRIWSQAITPHGINASLINAGQLNTDKILIYAGDNMAFQWNPEGVHAYKIDDSGFHKDIYVKYSQHGLHLINDTLSHIDKDGNKYDKWPENLRTYQHQSLVSIDWNGLTLRNHNGDRTLYADLDGNLSITGTLQSDPFTSGKEGWRIEREGQAEFNNVIIRSTLQSANYTDDSIIGTGWKIDEKGYGVFNDLKVRGTISAAVFEYQETSAVGGELYVAPTIILESQYTERASLTDWLNTIKVEVPFRSNNNDKYILAGREWKVGDLIGLNGCIEWRVNVNNKDVIDKGYDRIYIRNQEGQLEEYYQVIYEIKNYRAKITEITTETWKDESQHDIIKLGSYSGKLDATTQNLLYDKNGNQISLGDAFANFGLTYVHGSGRWNLIFLGSADTGREGILITAMAEQSPYIDILNDFAYKDEEGKTLINNSPRVRLGNLNGLWNNNPTRNFLVNDLKIDEKSDLGYGLFADNVYLRGSIYATSGKIGSLTIQDVETGHGQLSLKLTNDNNFIYTSQTTSYGFNCEVYFANKRITKKSDLPDIYKDVNFTFSYRRKPKSGNWGSFSNGTWNNIELFDSDGNIVNLEFKSSEALVNTYKATIHLDKTVLTQSTIDSPAYSFSYVQDGPQGESGSTVTGSSSVYFATKDDTKPANNADWKKTFAETGYSSTVPYLWQKTTYTYSKGDPVIIISLISRYGETGDPARNYKLVADYNSITRELGGSYMPSKITIKCNYTNGSSKEAVTDTSITTKSYFEVKVISYEIADGAIRSTESNDIVNNSNIIVSKGTITLNNIATLLSGYSKAANITVKLYSSDQNKDFLLDSISFPISIGEALTDLGLLQNDTVVVNKGKVIAESIVAGAITAGKIQTGAITAGALSNVGTLSLFTTKTSANYPKVDDLDSDGNYKYWNSDGTFSASKYDDEIAKVTKAAWDDATSGIQLSADGILMKGSKLLIDMGNFTIEEKTDSAGNKTYPVTINGDITATSGSIGGWQIDGESLVFKNNTNIYLRGANYDIKGEDDDNNTIHLASFSSNSFITSDGFLSAIQASLDQTAITNSTIANSTITNNIITYNQNKVPAILISANAPAKPDDEFSLNGGLLWLKPINSGTGGGTTPTEVASLSYEFDIGSGSTQVTKWTGERKKLIDGEDITAYGITPGRARRIAILKPKTTNKLSATDITKCTVKLSVPLQITSSDFTRYPVEGYIQAALYATQPYANSNNADSVNVNVNKTKCKVLFDEQKWSSNNNSKTDITIIFEKTFDSDDSAFTWLMDSQSTIYMEIWVNHKKEDSVRDYNICNSKTIGKKVELTITTVK